MAAAAIREAVLNAIVHRDYSTGVPIRIKVFPDKLIMYSQGGLPPDWTMATFLGHHGSAPRNPGIANAFFRSGQIEAWGRGIEKIETTSREAYKPLPIFEATSSAVNVTFPFSFTLDVGLSSPPGEEAGEDVGKSRRDVGKSRREVEEVGGEVILVLSAATRPQRRHELLAAAGLTDVYWNYQRHVLRLVEAGLLARTIPDKPTSRLQRYVITAAGRQLLAEHGQEADADGGLAPLDDPPPGALGRPGEPGIVSPGP
ncbi:MAG: hypothetical protein LBK42_09380 [Propionibacteriaceae bacterium]|nr:hypothetical protein [Propionibacteriaceae bacterium]